MFSPLQALNGNGFKENAKAYREVHFSYGRLYVEQLMLERII